MHFIHIHSSKLTSIHTILKRKSKLFLYHSTDPKLFIWRRACKTVIWWRMMYVHEYSPSTRPFSAALEKHLTALMIILAYRNLGTEELVVTTTLVMICSIYQQCCDEFWGVSQRFSPRHTTNNIYYNLKAFWTAVDTFRTTHYNAPTGTYSHESITHPSALQLHLSDGPCFLSLSVQ